MSSITQYIGTFCTSSGTSVFGFVTINNGVRTYKYFNTSNNEPYLGSVLENCNGGVSEETIRILNRNSYGDIQKIHGFLNVGNALLAVNRGLSTTLGESKLVYYPDYNNLQNKTTIFTSNFNIESICYSPVTNKVYIPLSGSVFINVLDLNTLTVTSHVPLPGLNTFGGSCPIVTDDTHLYIATESSSNKFYKILMSNMSLVATTVWTNNVYGAHSGVINEAKTEAYFAGNSGAFIAKLNLANMTYVELKLDIGGNTDDMAYIPPSAFPNNNNLVVLCHEGHNKFAGTIVNMDTMVQYTIPLMGGFAMYFSEVTNKLYNLTIGGLIMTYDLEDILQYLEDPQNPECYLLHKYKVYKSSLNDVMFNEMQITSNGKIFVTDWSETLRAKIFEIDFIEKDNPYVIDDEKKLFSDNKVTTIKNIDANYRVSMEDNNSMLICNTTSPLIQITIPIQLPIGYSVTIISKNFSEVEIVTDFSHVPFPVGNLMDTAIKATIISTDEIFVEKINFLN